MTHETQNKEEWIEMHQNDQTMRMAASGELRPPMSAPDETGMRMPPEAASTMNNSWVYGDPSLGYAGQLPPGGAESFTVSVREPAPIQGMNSEGRLEEISSAAAQSQRMKNPVDMEGTHMPANASEAYQASLRSLLNRNVGYFVVATFQIGPQQSVTWQGILHTVGSDYIVLFQPDYERYISGDLYSLKFVQFHNVKGVPYCAAAQSWQGQSNF
ncbi:MAG: hypothetical protein HFF80_02630 [Oscillospiraceae bacterium]|jgi:hypothetical protein|nr:hypothetical protein [Oscillospiraceae bacterium]